MTEKKESRGSSMTMPRSVHSMGWATNIRELSSRTSIVAKHGGAKEIGISGAGRELFGVFGEENAERAEDGNRGVVAQVHKETG